MPLAVIGWHLPQPLTEPPLIIAAGARMHAPVAGADGLTAVIDAGFALLVEAMEHIAQAHRAWAVGRLPAGSADRRSAEQRLGDLYFDVEGQDELEDYLRSLYPERLSVAATKGPAVTRGRKIMALVFAMVLGADSIADCEVLRAGRTRQLLGGWIAAPAATSTLARISAESSSSTCIPAAITRARAPSSAAETRVRSCARCSGERSRSHRLVCARDAATSPIRPSFYMSAPIRS